MLRLLKTPNAPAEAGWTACITPLGASAHVRINSAAHELCEDWRMLSSGRMQLVQKANFAHWFGPLLTKVPIGLAAELLLANGMEDPFAMLLASETGAREYILRLPEHCFGIDEEEAQLLGIALDLAGRLEARLAARAAAAEALGDA